MAREMKVVPYDPNWPLLYKAEKGKLKRIFTTAILDIQHFGSTSIEGMTAKPIIDVMIVVERIETVDSFSNSMAAGGYLAKGENGIPGRRYFVRLSDDGENHAAHIHVYETGNPHIKDELMFRDFLIINKPAFIKYESAKTEAAEKHRFSPAEYTDAKRNCVMEIVDAAKRHYNTK